MASFPDTSIFNSIEIADQRAEIGSIDASGKTYNRFLKQRWQLELQSIPLTTAQYQSIYPFLVQQNGESGVFTFQYPLNPMSTKQDSLDYSSVNYKLARNGTTDALTKGSTSYSNAYLADTVNNLGTGEGFLYSHDFIKFANHSKVYKIAGADSSGVTLFNANTGVGSPSGNLNIYPALVEDVPIDTVITVYRPNFKVRLIGDVQSFETDIDGKFEIKMSLVEDY
tara:strand:+ start:263 stop:937 length:675 start_codon:yes stop_codon:yes gene_type:complete